MRRIDRTNRFKQDFKRELRGRFRSILVAALTPILEQLANDQNLELKYRDHALTGIWKNHRDCHIKPDLVLIYLKPDDHTLILERLGSHSELGL